MVEFNIDQISGRSTGLHGIERAMSEHVHDPHLLVGVEISQRNPEEMKLYMLTGNILHAIFPQNFPKIVKAGTDETAGKSYAVVRKINGKQKWEEGEYAAAEKKFLANMQTVISGDRREELEHCFDFKNGSKNLLVDEHTNPVYVDRVSPAILELIDLSLMEHVVKHPKKAEILKRAIQKTVTFHHEWIKKSDELDKLMKKRFEF